MKKNKMLPLILILICLMGNTFAQTEEPQKPKVFGFGLNIDQIRLNDGDDLRPVTKFIIVLNAAKWLKIEPEFGLFFLSDDVNNSSQVLNVGLGLFAMKKRTNNFNIYVGIRTDYTEQNERYNTAAPLFVIDYTVLKFSFGPTVGCEYFFIRNFSIGGELGLKYNKIIPPDGSDLPDDVKVGKESIYIESGLKLRFYF